VRGPHVDTSTVGSHTFTVDSTDNVGNAVTQTSITYNVTWSFSDFLRPIDNKDAMGNYILNTTTGGSAIPVKFSLGGDRGLNVMAAGYPSSGQIACTNTATTDAIEQTVTAGGSSLSYDTLSGIYTYVWKTDKAWAGTCRQHVVQLVDGTTHRASFKFSK
jgi:hypothetical protein